MIFQNFKNLIKKSSNRQNASNKKQKKGAAAATGEHHKHDVIHSESIPSSQESSLNNTQSSLNRNASGSSSSPPSNQSSLTANKNKQASHGAKPQNKSSDKSASTAAAAAAAAANNRFPELEGKYILEEQIGEGAFSTVHKGIDLLNHNRHVAIKIISKKNINKAQTNSIIKEINIMKKLNHKNIVKLYDAIESPKNFFLILEFCAGGEIFKQIINFTYFSEELSRHIIIQVASAIKYLHEEIGVAHRDIKPENLLFVPCEYKPRPTEEFVKSKRQSDGNEKIDEGYFTKGTGGGGIGVVKLADFGLSKVLWNTTTQTPCGTAGYTAPEIVKVEKYSKSVDLWAIGCVLYTLLCGFPPFYDDNNDQAKLLDKNLKGEYEFLSPWWDEISTDAKRLVQNLLNVNPLMRYNIDQLLTDSWITKGIDLKALKSRQTQPRHYNETSNVDYFPNYQSLIVEEISPISSVNNSNRASPVTTPNRITGKGDEKLMQKERKYKSIFNRNMEFERENSDLLTANKPFHNESGFKFPHNESSLSPGLPLHLEKLNEEDDHSSSVASSPIESQTSTPGSSARYKMKNVILKKGNDVSKSGSNISKNSSTITLSNIKHEGRKKPVPILVKNNNGLSTKSSLQTSDSWLKSSNSGASINHGSSKSGLVNGSTSLNMVIDIDPSRKDSVITHNTAVSSLTDSLSAVSFVKRKNTLPRTPCPVNLKFETVSDAEEESLRDENDPDQDGDEFDNEDSSSEDEYVLGGHNKSSKLKKLLKTPDSKPNDSYRPDSSGNETHSQLTNKSNMSKMSFDSQMSNNIENSLNNFSLNLNNSAMLKRRRGSSAIIGANNNDAATPVK